MALIDEYAGDAERFPVLRRWNYLNHAGVSPLPKPVADAIRRFADEFASNSYLGAVAFGEVLRLKQSLGRLINAQAVEIALMKNVGEAISTVALGLDWRPGDRVVLPAGEYPANFYPWMEAARRFGIELAVIPQRTRADGSRWVDPDELLAAATEPRCRVVAVSHVAFGSGQRLPVERLGQWCRENGRLFCVDAIQSLGALPVDVQAARIDFLAAGSQKWMLGPMGAAMLYVRRDLIDVVRPLAVGAYSVVDPDNYTDYNYTFQPDMRRHECGTPPLPAIIGWRPAVELLLDVGVEAVAARIRGLTDRLTDGLRESGWKVASPRDGEAWSGIVSFARDAQTPADLERAALRLRERDKIELVVRDGRLRASPHFYNTAEQMDAVVEALR